MIYISVAFLIVSLVCLAVELYGEVHEKKMAKIVAELAGEYLQENGLWTPLDEDDSAQVRVCLIWKGKNNRVYGVMGDMIGRRKMLRITLEERGDVTRIQLMQCVGSDYVIEFEPPERGD